MTRAQWQSPVSVAVAATSRPLYVEEVTSLEDAALPHEAKILSAALEVCGA
ncbi:hypothetical protein [Capillimicrobium parvum]|uniref:Uncharacterized protein n=1 Tax=Capillimicrobium parvum TaxID=2884022 RepID=A0A9E6XW79_9ACTN|nr:hypothetical protein [Capillimicrobium parvum]UGS35568.1 hypothetical protein DSM104329_01961 [Capillimicrobium parvum]